VPDKNLQFLRILIAIGAVPKDLICHAEPPKAAKHLVAILKRPFALLRAT
jgi:hypothetical protein